MPDYSYEVGEHLSIALYAAPSLKTWELMGSEFLFSKFRAANFCREQKLIRFVESSISQDFPFINPFHATALFQYPQRFSDVFRGYPKETSGMKWVKSLTLSWRRPLSYRNQSTDLLRKSMDWFLYDSGLRHERVKYVHVKRKMLLPI